VKNKIRKVRLDQLLVERGLSPTRSKAQALIMACKVKVEDKIFCKAGTRVPEDAIVEIIKPPHPYVGRGGLKLEKALDEFNISVEGKTCIDAGASTGGFTHCLLLRGAVKVYAIDVGYGQLAFKLRKDPRVIVLEKCNVRYLSEENVPEKVDIITADVSFISLEKVIKSLLNFIRPGGIFIPLIKPQFEAERKFSRKGVVRDEKVRIAVVEKIVTFAESLGLVCLGTTESPIKGPKGNVEYLGCFILQ